MGMSTVMHLYKAINFNETYKHIDNLTWNIYTLVHLTVLLIVNVMVL